MHHHKRSVLLWLLINIKLFALCNYIPTSFSDAEIALENGEIDSLCFIQYRSLLLNPINPILEGWRELRELSYELDSREFPDYAELKAFQNRKDELVEKYPWLTPYNSLFSLKYDSTELPIAITLKSEILTEVDKKGRSAVKTVVREKDGRTKFELGVSLKEQSVKPILRSAAVAFPKERGIVSLGNFVLDKNSLVWGAFQYFDSDTAEQYLWLYGTKRSWNGGAFQINGARVSGGASGHVRYSERGGHGFTQVHLNRISFKLLGGYQENEYGTAGIVQLASYSPRGIVQITHHLEHGLSLLANYSILSEEWKSEGELWFMSKNYAPTFSKKNYELNRLFDHAEQTASATGWTVRTAYKPGMWQFRFTFDGILLDRQGVSDNSLGIRKKGVFSFGLKNRIRFLYRYGEKEQLWEQRGDCKVGILDKKILFPLSGNNVIENGIWQRASANMGVLLKPGRGKYHVEWYHKWKRTSVTTYGIRSSISQYFGKNGRGALLLTLPFESSSSVVIQAVVEISI